MHVLLQIQRHESDCLTLGRSCKDFVPYIRTESGLQTLKPALPCPACYDQVPEHACTSGCGALVTLA